MSDQNPPEQGSFGSPPPGSDPVGPGAGSTPPAGSGSVATPARRRRPRRLRPASGRRRRAGT